MITELKISLPAERITNANRELVHRELIIRSNLEMYQRSDIVYSGIVDQINNDPELTPEQRQQLLDRYRPGKYESETAGTFVNPSTGEMMIPGENGFPPGAVTMSELEFWQNLPAAFFTAENLSQYHPDIDFYPGNTLAELVYNGLLFSMAKMRERQRV